MRVVITHSNSDCDAFASQVAVQVLRPDTRIVLSRRVAPRVYRFLTLHRDLFELTAPDDIDASEVREIIAVDVDSRARLREHAGLIDEALSAGATLRFVDHHVSLDDTEVDPSVADVQDVGATTTILVERIRDEHAEIDAVRATLFALAIHVDTGSLTYDTTTRRDIEALHWLSGQGAHLDVIEDHLRLPLSDGQRLAFLRLMESIDVWEVDGVPVGVAGVSLDSGVDGLAYVTTQALRLGDYAALIAGFHIKGRKLQLVGRSRAGAINVGALMSTLGGGGHESAGAATIKTERPLEVLQQIRESLPSHRRERAGFDALLRRKIPTVGASVSLRAAQRDMMEAGARYRFVRDAEAFTGTLELAQANNAVDAGRGDHPVKSSMHHHVHEIEIGASLEDALRAFRLYDTGVLLVVDEAGDAVGYLDRAACVAHVYESSSG